eukprot:XP_025010776.1 uncharacterized protein LOC112533431 [Gallus gallus]
MSRQCTLVVTKASGGESGVTDLRCAEVVGRLFRAGAAARAPLPAGFPAERLLDGHAGQQGGRQQPGALGHGAARRHAQVVGVGQGALAEVGRHGGARRREAPRAQAAQDGGRPGPAQARQQRQSRAQQEGGREQRQRQHQREAQLRRRVGGRRALAQLRQRVPHALGQHHVQRGRGRQRRLPVVLHHGHQPLLRRVPLRHGPRRAHLAAARLHAEQRRLRRLQQLVRQPRVAPRVRVHRHHLGHQVAGLGRARHHLERPRARAAALRPARRRPQHPRRVVVAVQHEDAHRRRGAARGRPAVPRPHLHGELAAPLVVERALRVQLARLRSHRHERRVRAAARQRVAHAPVGARVRVPRAHAQHRLSRRVVLGHVGAVGGLLEHRRVVVHVRHLQHQIRAARQRRAAPVRGDHRHPVLGRPLPVQRSRRHHFVGAARRCHDLQRRVSRQLAPHLPVLPGVSVPHFQ